MVSMRLIDDTPPSPENKFIMRIHTFSVQDSWIAANEGYALVGILPKPSQHLITSIAVRNEISGEYINNGSFYFHCDEYGKITLEEGVHFPKNLRQIYAGENRFDIHIVSTLPDLQHLQQINMNRQHDNSPVSNINLS